IVQDVWQWLVTNLSRLEDVNKFSSWIRTIVDRRSIDWVRKHQKERVNQDKFAYGNDQIDNTSATNYTDGATDDDGSEMNALEMSLNQLNAESKLILVLYYLESNSIESIASILCIPKGTVKSRLFHAREKLKKILKQKSYEKSK
ncbi:sigma-70 family RNA polymerase sigma factor, partial [Reichenbachiella sp.]